MVDSRQERVARDYCAVMGYDADELYRLSKFANKPPELAAQTTEGVGYGPIVPSWQVELLNIRKAANMTRAVKNLNDPSYGFGPTT